MECGIQLVILLLVFVQQPAAQSLNKETVLKRVRRIVGGYRSEVRQQPYMVNIRRGGQLQCGGSLVTPRCVLTAGHCQKNGKTEGLVVRGGVTYLSDMRNARYVRHIYVPPGYNETTLHQDVAILQLQQPLRGTHIQTIQLGNTLPAAGSYLLVSGWGLTNEHSEQLPNQLHSVQVQLMERTLCQRLYEGYRHITDTMYCAAVPGFKDACSADSGGPAVDAATGKLVGIVSWGKAYRCAHKQSPGVYTNVAQLYDWISHTMRSHCY